MEENRTIGAVDPPRVGKRVLDRLDPRLVKLLTALGFGIPIAGYFWIVAGYSVNVIMADQWSDVGVIKASYARLIPWSALWQPWHENRMLFPHLIVIVLSRTVLFNIQVEEYLSATMLLGSTALLIWAHKRRSPRTPWLYYCPVALLEFSVVQYGNTLWGFQMAWYLVLLSLAFVIVLLDGVTLTWLALVGATAAAVVGSFSSFQGLLIYPVGLVLLYHRRRSAPFVIGWFAAGVASVLLYFDGFNPLAGTSLESNFAGHHPLAVVKFYLFLVGDVVGASPGHTNGEVITFGAVMVVLAVAVLVVCGIRRDEHGGSPIGLALICFGLLFAVSTTDGRIIFGYTYASASRYTTYDLLILVGIYLALLGRPAPPVYRGKSMTDAVRERQLKSSVARIAPASARSIATMSLAAVRWLVGAAIVVQIFLGLSNGLPQIRSTSLYQQHLASFLVHLNGNYDALFSSLGPYALPGVIRQELPTAQQHHLSMFATSNVPPPPRTPFPPATVSKGPAPSAKMLRPHDGARVSGVAILDAWAPNATGVSFWLSGNTSPVCTAKPSTYGWLCRWNSAIVRDGQYALFAEAFNSSGSAVSPKVRITVENPAAAKR